MFKNLPESIKYKEDNRKKLISLAFISILWIFSLSTSTVANILFYDAQLEERPEFSILCATVPTITYPNCYGIREIPNSFQFYLVGRPIYTSCGFKHHIELTGEQNSTLWLESSDSKTISRTEKAIRTIALNQVEAETPALARSAGVSGKVVVKLLINENGIVASTKIISGHPLLQQSALKATKEWTFKPSFLGDTPVKVESQLTFRFSK